jgi:hypothetical protein
VDNITDLKRCIYGRANSTNPHLMLSADHLYLKVLTNVLMRLQQPSPNSLLQPLASFLDSRIHTLSLLLDLFRVEEIAKLEETVEMLFYELSAVMTHLIFLSETSFYELIAASFLDSSQLSKPAVFEFF